MVDPFFKKYKHLSQLNFQGTDICESADIVKLFERAKKNSGNSNVLIVFDEIGLAENSPHNPLKVLH